MNADSSLDAVVSAFIRYPEMSAIRYEARNNTVAMEMILKGNIVDKQQKRFLERIKHSLALFHKIHQINPVQQTIKFVRQRDITILTWLRDNSSLSEEEIELFVILVNQDFSAVLLTDGFEYDLNGAAYHDFKKTVMQKISRVRHPYKKVFAYRDQGKMFVFDK